MEPTIIDETYKLFTKKLQRAYDKCFTVNYNVFIVEILLFIAALLMEINRKTKDN